MLKALTKVSLSSIVCVFVLAQCSIAKQDIQKTNKDLIGEITIRDIESSNHKEWFGNELNSYLLDRETLDKIMNDSEKLKSISVTIFMGTWCSDSRREVPRFYDILRYLNISDFKLIGMDWNKSTPQQFEKGLTIKFVPTFIIYQNGIEINRIVESPVQSLEKDLMSIIQEKNYSPKYH